MPTVELPAAGGLEVGPLLRTLADHATPGSDVVTVEGSGSVRDSPSGRYRRLLELADGPTSITVQVHRAGLRLQAPAAALEEAAARIIWWFDLATDPAPIAAALRADPRLTALVDQRPALRPLRHPDGFEAAIDTVVGQQVTLSSARLFGQRLRAAYSPGSIDGLRVFPRPETLARAPLEELRAAVGLTSARARTVQAVAALFAAGFTLGPGSDPVAARAELLQVPGVGPWTVEYLALRALGDADAFPASDAVVRRALDGAGAAAAQQVSQSWRPYRGWATAHLWAGQRTG